MAGEEERAGSVLSPLLPVAVSLAAVAMALKHRAAEDARGSEILSARASPARTVRGETPLRRLKTIVLTVYGGINNHRVLALAGGVAFFSLLALFPAIAALVSLYGLFANPSTISADLQQLSDVLPGGAIEIIKDQLTRLAQQQQSTLGLAFAIGVTVSLWSANSGIKALIDALNVVRGENERRSFIKLNAISLAFTTAAVFFVIFAMIAVVAVPIVLNYLGLNQAAPMLLAALRWPALFVATTWGLAMIYRYGPCCRAPDWHWLSFGSLFAAVVWLVASFLFSWYAAKFGSYNKTYGSLGAVIGFMTWIWISAIVVLVGAELDTAIAQIRRPNPAFNEKM